MIPTDLDLTIDNALARPGRELAWLCVVRVVVRVCAAARWARRDRFRYDVDVTSACRSDEHGRFIRAVDATPDTPEARALLHDVTVAIVPGAFYVEYPKTGADGRFVLDEAARLGCKTTRVPLLSFGPLRENAQCLLEWLDRQPAQPIILVSLSKAGAEVRLAPRRYFRSRPIPACRGLVQLQRVGPRDGDGQLAVPAPTAGVSVRLLFRWNGYSYGALHELERWPGILDADFHIPEDLLTIHLYGFPLVRHLSRPIARRGHSRLAPLGPNDGGASLLADLVGLPGSIYPVWGADHYLQPAWDIDGLVRAIVALRGRATTGQRRHCRYRKQAIMRIQLLSPAGDVHRHGSGIFKTALRYAPLTLTTLAALVPEELNAEVAIQDEGVQPLDLSFDADLVGITAITGTALRAYRIADELRERAYGRHRRRSCDALTGRSRTACRFASARLRRTVVAPVAARLRRWKPTTSLSCSDRPQPRRRADRAVATC